MALHVLKGPRIPETPGHPFLCEHFRGTLMGGECLRRQTTRKKANANAKDQSERIPRHLEYCASGECSQGAEIAAKFPEWEPSKPTRPHASWASMGMLGNPKPPPDPLPGAVADEIAVDLAAAAQQAERDRVAAAVEERAGWEEFRARKEKQRATAPVEPVRPPPICKADGCRTALRVNNLSGLCRLHRNKVTSRKRERLVPPVARAAGTAGNALGAETPGMGQKVCTCGKKIRTGRDGVLHHKCLKCRRDAGEAGDGHRPPKKPKRKRGLNRNGDPAQPRLIPPAQPVKALPGLLQAAPQDLEQLLAERQAHHLAEAERCGRALRALRGGA